jgi:hypothetical protein
MYDSIAFIVALLVQLQFVPKMCLFVLYRNWHVESMQVFRISSIEIFKITNQNTVLALSTHLHVYIQNFLEGGIPIHYDDIIL